MLLNSRPMPLAGLKDIPFPSEDSETPQRLIARCPVAAQTPLVALAGLATDAGVGALFVKDERNRMQLGSFKALGAAYVIAGDAQDGPLGDRTYVTASAGNHGLSVAAGAAAFGARAVVYLAQTVPESFAQRLTAQGAEVRRVGAIYEESMAAAQAAAVAEDMILLSDSSWPGYTTRPHRLMEGYLVLMAEAIEQMETPPSHIFLQAGVGGLAGACAALARKAWGAGPKVIVVEPQAAPGLHASVSAGKCVTTQGPASEMGRLDCKEPSLIALKGLARDADAFVLVSEEEGVAGADAMAGYSMASSPSGGAGVAALLAADRQQRAALGLHQGSRVLCILSEGPA